MNGLGAIFLLIFSIEVVANDSLVNEEMIKIIKAEGAYLYQQLLTMKKDESFLARGFADPKSKEWDNKVRKLDDKCIAEIHKLPLHLRLDGELSDLCTAINYMGQMGLHYAKHRSTDDKFTNNVKNQVQSAFGKSI